MEKHDLHHEFEKHEQRIHDLKISDNHFRRLFDDYHKVDKDIHRLEANEIYTDEELTLLRKKRLKLKDQLFAILNENQN